MISRLTSAMLMLSLAAAGQSIGLGSQGVQRVELRIRLFTEDGKQPLTGLRLQVRLMDGFGTTQEEKTTDDQGAVAFTTKTGFHRIWISGPEVEEVNKEINIENFESSRLEIVRVKVKSGRMPVLIAPDSSATVNVTRLNIPPGAKKEFKKGSLELQRRQWKEARQHFEVAVLLYPEYDLAYNGLGVAACNSGDVEGGRSALEKAISLNEHFAAAYRNLARIYLAEHNWERTNELLTKSLQDEPLNDWALTNLAYSQLQSHHLDDAVATARRVHQIPHRGSANAHYIAALALEDLKRPAEALAEYQTYVREAPAGPNATRAREAIARLSANRGGSQQ